MSRSSRIGSSATPRFLSVIVPSGQGSPVVLVTMPSKPSQRKGWLPPPDAAPAATPVRAVTSQCDRSCLLHTSLGALRRVRAGAHRVLGRVLVVDRGSHVGDGHRDRG